MPAEKYDKTASKIHPSWADIILAGSAAETVEAIATGKPQLIFLDIHMHDSSSLDWLRTLGACPPVIIITGDPSFAVSAFEIEVLDYIVKPVTVQRLFKALERFEKWPKNPGPPPALKNILASRGREVVSISIADVKFFKSDSKTPVWRAPARKGWCGQASRKSRN